MGAPDAAAAAASAAPAVARGARGPVVLDAEGRPVQLGGARGTACAAKVCYGVLLFSSQDVGAQRGPVRRGSRRSTARRRSPPSPAADAAP